MTWATSILDTTAFPYRSHLILPRDNWRTSIHVIPGWVVPTSWYASMICRNRQSPPGTFVQTPPSNLNVSSTTCPDYKSTSLLRVFISSLCVCGSVYRHAYNAGILKSFVRWSCNLSSPSVFSQREVRTKHDFFSHGEEGGHIEGMDDDPKTAAPVSSPLRHIIPVLRGTVGNTPTSHLQFKYQNLLWRMNCLRG